MGRRKPGRKELLALIGSDLPLIQAPMAGSQGSALAIAVSNAGGLGSLPCGLLNAEMLRSELQAIRAGTTRSCNVNFFCHQLSEPNLAREGIWRSALGRYYLEFDVDISAIQSGPGRQPFSAEMAAVLEEFRPRVVSFHFGLPPAPLLARVKALGASVIASATTVDEARWLEASGVDAIIAQGLEAGGHRAAFLTDDITTQLSTMALVRQIVRTVDVPVIAAGGIADSEGVAAATALGAAGVQVGTAYLLCHEATTTPIHRSALRGPTARHTALTNLFTGRPARAIVNRLMQELGPMSALAPQFPFAAAAVAPLRSKAEAAGRDDFSSLWAGQNVTGCKEISAAELTLELAKGFE